MLYQFMMKNIYKIYKKYIKTKIRTYGDRVYTNFCGLNVPEDGVECESLLQSFPLILYLFMREQMLPTSKFR